MIANLHNAEIRVQSTLGVGTKIEVCFLHDEDVLD
ncbi:hypothetical protein [Sulfurospirillum sp. 1612]